MWALDPHRQQQRISSASLFLQCSPLCLNDSLSSPGSILSRMLSVFFSESRLCLDLDRHYTQDNVSILTSSSADELKANSDCTHFLRIGQSFIKWPILPQMRQQRSLGATSPSVRTSGSKKYSCKTNHSVSPQVMPPTLYKCGIQTANNNHLTGVLREKDFNWCAEHRSAIDESLHDEVSHCIDRNQQRNVRMQEYSFEKQKTERN